jgi:acetyl-CoA carboxylase biotin carboxylase subunit
MDKPEWMEHAPKPISSILVANRGEIACRIIRACQEMGIEGIAIQSESDLGSLHSEMGDRVVTLPGETLAETYLNGAAIIDAAKTCGADAIHPGYGFLSERSEFAQSVTDAGLIWIGPSPEAIDSMGDKVTARRRMENASVPVIPGQEVNVGNDENSTIDSLVDAATFVGYPLLLKASAGGGGKGMRIVREPKLLQQEFTAAQREAESAFGDGTVYIERLLENSRHIEVQILADNHGNTLHLFERECSIQRRHQKVVEEAPSPVLNSETREAMGLAAVSAAQAVSYSGAGTVEFLLSEDGSFYFLEMNTRIQVEHPVTECISGIDLVEQQIRVASGLPLPFSQKDLSIRGHAIEVRIYAEDPSLGFLPATGPLAVFHPPEGPGVRLDTGVRQGDEARIDFDPMLAKLIVHGSDRDQAIRRMNRALKSFVILGATTNIGFLIDIMQHPSYILGDTTTNFIDIHFPEGWTSPTIDLSATMIAASAEHLGLHRNMVNVSSNSQGRTTSNDPFLQLSRRYP